MNEIRGNEQNDGFEERLRDEMHREVIHLRPNDDLDDLSARLRRRARRGRSLAVAAAAVALLAGSAAGFAAGRRSGTRDASSVLRADNGTSGATTTAAPSATVAYEGGTTTAPIDPAFTGKTGGDGTSATTLAPAPSGPVSEPVATTVPAPGIDGPVYGGGGSVLGPNDRRLADHDLGNGVLVRAYAESQNVVPVSWPPAYCNVVSTYVLHVSSPEAVGLFLLPVYGTDPDLPMRTQIFALGVSGPGEWALFAVTTAPEVKTVKVTLDGVTAEGTAVDGFAVVALHHDMSALGPRLDPNSGSSTSLNATYEARDAAGKVIATVTDTQQADTMAKRYDPASGACVVPALPAPGSAQPADVVAAQQAVIDAYEAVYSVSDLSATPSTTVPGTIPSGVAKYLDGADTLGATLGQVVPALQGFGRKGTGVSVGAIVFTDATHASLLYTINLDGGPFGGKRLGAAVLVDGVWKVSRTTFCNDIGLAGLRCP